MLMVEQDGSGCPDADPAGAQTEGTECGSEATKIRHCRQGLSEMTMAQSDLRMPLTSLTPGRLGSSLIASDNASLALLWFPLL